MTTPAGLLEGKVVLITGAGGGIGSAVCQLFAKEGAQIAAVDIHQENMDKALGALEGSHQSFYTDVTSRSAVEELMLAIQRHFDGKVPSVAILAAGNEMEASILDMTDEMFDSLIAVHMKGTFLMMQASARCMVERGIKNGSIITFSSIAAKVAYPTFSGYSAVKAAIIAMTKSASKEWGRIPIRCNALMPGTIDTPLLAQVDKDLVKALVENNPLRRLGTPNEVADACLFLASDKSAYINGEVLEISGGGN